MNQTRSPLRQYFHTSWGYFQGKKFLLALWLLSPAAALILTVRLSVFMIDADRKAYATTPQFEATNRHNCLTAYFIAASLLGKEGNIYDSALYRKGNTEVESLLPLRSFDPEPYQYPPQFLLLPKTMLLFTNNFLILRTTWYCAEIIIVLGMMVVASVWVGGHPGLIMLLWIPLIWITPFQFITLQIGNIHFIVIGLAVLGLIFMEKGWHAGGGALLAFATVTKVFPGVLALFLLIQRRWLAFLWTAGFGVLYTIAAAVLGGLGPLKYFITDQLPSLLSGEAFSFSAGSPWYVAANVAARGVLFKLESLGVIRGAEELASLAGYAYSFFVIGATAILAIRTINDSLDTTHETRLTKLQIWLLLINLSSWQSPFLPAIYGTLGILWLLATFAPLKRIPTILFLPLWITLGVFIPYTLASLVAHFIILAFLAFSLIYLYQTTNPQ